MKKRLIVIFLAVLFLALVGWFFAQKPPKSGLVLAENSDNSYVLSLPKSFRGTLNDIISDIAKEAREIGNEAGETISNPFDSARVKSPETRTPSGEDSFSFAILGDTQRFTSGNPQGNFQKSVAGIMKQNPDMVIAVGDLVNNCKGESDDAQDFANWKNALGALASKTFAVQGNHERVQSLDKCDRFWTDTFSFPTNGPAGFAEFAYSLDFKNSHFVFLDSEKPDAHQVNKTQRDWLEQDLSRNKKENIFVIFHEQAYPTGYKAGESLDFEPSQRNALWQIIDKYDVTGVFNGHEHITSRRKIDSRVFSSAKNSVYQFGFGSTDSFDHTLPVAGVAEFANKGQGRYGIVRVNGKKITVETYGPGEKILDTFTFSK